MKNTNFKINFIATSVAVSAPLLVTAQKAEKNEKPNIVFVLTDQWRGDALGYAGDKNIKTPNLDRFSKEAVNFTNAVSVCPVSTPARAALLTGRFPTSTGMTLNDIYLPSEELCIAEILKEAGYNTAHIGGKWHVDGHGRLNNVVPERRQGFDFWKGIECSHEYNNEPYYENDDPTMKYWEGYSPYAICNAANDYISDAANSEKPFFLFVSIGTPHYPHGTAPKEMKDMYPKDQLVLNPNVPKSMEDKVRQELQGYYGHCTATDKGIGTIIEQLKANNMMENTIFVFTSDHGEMMGAQGYKPFTKLVAYDESIRIPFLISYPGIGKNKGAVVNAPINIPDMLPTLLGLAKIKIPSTIEGDNLAKLVKRPNTKADRAALVMQPTPWGMIFQEKEFRAIRTKRYTYSRTIDAPNMLFDNVTDPYQMNNLVNKPEFAKLQKEMDKKLNKALKKIGDEFKPRDYYMKKWNFKLSQPSNAVDFRGFETGDGKGTVQTPGVKK